MPEPAITPLDQRQVDDLECVLGARTCRKYSPAMVEVGARWIIAQLDDADAVLAVRPDLQMMREHNLTGRATGVVILGECSPNGQDRVAVVAFAPSVVVNQDSECRSGNGAVAAFLQYTSQIGRTESIHLALQVDPIRAEGAAATRFDGNAATLPMPVSPVKPSISQQNSSLPRNLPAIT